MSKFSSRLLAGVMVAVFFGIALYLRIYLPYGQVFSGEWIKFTGSDPYYHMHLIDNFVHNFPHLMSFDPYFIYPGGLGVGGIRFFEWFLGSIIWVIGLGSPDQHTIDVVAVYFPTVLGALTVIPVYFIGKELFNRWAGVVSAGLIAIMPGEFLGRSILGFTDNHVTETLFTTVTMLFLILAVKTARQRQFGFGRLGRSYWAENAKPLIYSLLSGIFLGIYLLTWLGALLFVFIISVYFIVQFIIDHLRHESTDYLCLVGVILFFIALIMFLPVSPGSLHTASLVVALFIPLILNGVSRLMTAGRIKLFYYPLTLVGLGVVGLAIFYVISPSLLGSMLGAFDIFVPSGTQLTTLEMQPILSPGGSFSTIAVWGNFNTGSYFSSISLVILVIYLVIKRGESDKSLLVVWSLVILAATLGQRRFAYYYAVNVALLTGYLSIFAYYLIRFIIRFIIDSLNDKRTDYMSWQTLGGFFELKEEIVQPVKLPARTEKERARRGRRQEAGFHISATHISTVLGIVIVVFLLGFFPSITLVRQAKQAGGTFGEAWWQTSLIGTAVATAEQARFAPSDAWCNSLAWLKENTPDPFDNPDFYYELHKSPFEYPESAYGVMAWWDYGYWITRIAHRLPNANPSQDPRRVTKVARFFTSPDEESVNEMIQEMDSAYIIVDYDTAVSKFWAIATWGGRKETEFYDVYFELKEDQLVPRVLFYPEYYQSMSTRLYNFDGEAVVPYSTIVISFEEGISQGGKTYKQITSAKQFGTYEDAEAYLSRQNSANYRIVGDRPFVSPVPLEALKHYKLVYSSDSQVGKPGGGTVPAVKTFEYTE